MDPKLYSNRFWEKRRGRFSNFKASKEFLFDSNTTHTLHTQGHTSTHDWFHLFIGLIQSTQVQPRHPECERRRRRKRLEVTVCSNKFDNDSLYHSYTQH